MEKPTREDLEAQWQRLWEWGEELKARRLRLMDSPTMEEGLYDRAMDQIDQERKQRRLEIRELERLMEEHGGFER